MIEAPAQDGPHQTDTQTKRKVGAPIGNWNRLVHGKRSKRIQAERLKAWRAEWTARELASLAWTKAQPGFVTDWGKILDDLARWKRDNGCD